MTSTRDGQRKRSAVITGAGSGLGRDIALGLAAKGYRVFGTAMSSEEIADLRKASDGAVNLSQCDIIDEAAVKAWANEVTIQDEGWIDLLISNAGILTPGPLDPGQRVAWVYTRGSYAEQIAITATSLVPVPDAIDDRTAASVMMQGLITSHLASEFYPVQPGDVAFVHGRRVGSVCC
jgi:NAD(P)-dependent dehydrogenase (short-subunit alcohol dehydrogenase family)